MDQNFEKSSAELPPFPRAPWGYPPPKQPNGCLSAFKILLVVIGGFVLLTILFGSLSGAMLGAFSSALTASGELNQVSEKTISGNPLSKNKIVILPIEGLITEEEDGFIRNAIRRAYEDPTLHALILRVNSPGGTCTGSDYYYSLLKRLKEERKIPIIVSMGPMATSGGYYVSMAGDEIFAERSTVTGSIGVICMMMNAAGLCEKLGITSNNIVSGPLKSMGDFTRTMSDAERAIWQKTVDDGYQQFLGVVREGRPAFAEKDGQEGKSPDGKTLEEIADGRVYSAADAKELGLIDGIGFLDEAIAAAFTRTGLPKDESLVVRYKKSEGIFDLITQVKTESASERLGSLAETLAVPTRYYLAPGTMPTK